MHVDTLLTDPRVVVEDRTTEARLAAERRASLLPPIVMNLNKDNKRVPKMPRDAHNGDASGSGRSAIKLSYNSD